MRVAPVAGGWRLVGADREATVRRTGGRSRVEVPIGGRAWSLAVPGAGDGAALAVGYVSGELDAVALLALTDLLGGSAARVGAEPLRGAEHFRSIGRASDWGRE